MGQFMYIIFVVCMALLPVSNCDGNSFPRGSKFIIILDANYNRTTVTTFYFETKPGEKLKFLSAYKEETTPGLPTYFKNPKECLPGLKRLIDNAQTLIPLPQRRTTPLLLIGTTGFRLHKHDPWSDMSETILHFFKKTGLQVGNDAVSLMEGRKKVYLWLSINLNLDRLENKRANTVTTVNLGSRYMHYAFAPEDDDSMPFWRWKLVRNLTAFDLKREIYSYSYFGLGFNEVRRKVIEQDFKEKYKQYRDVYVSECISQRMNTTWTFNGKEYKILGAPNQRINETISKTECLKRINKVLNQYVRGASLDGKEILATSHFYQVALESKLVERGSEVSVTLKELYDKARTICGYPWRAQVFTCMDLLYMHALFKRIYTLTDQTKIRLATTLNGHELDWPLGAAFEVYQQGINNIGSLVQRPTFS